jgi:protein-disulfide isomerase
MDRRFLGILTVLVLVFIGIFAISKHSSNSPSNSNKTNANALPTSHITGQGKQNVTLLEYGDYQCPICGLYYQPIKAVVDQFKDKIFFQFRNLPLVSIHPNAFSAARAAEAAGLQNKYWEMHDTLYENQSVWAASSSPLNEFAGYAQQLGLNVDQFKKDYASAKVNDAINADLAAFNKTGQEMATPSIFIDGKYVDLGKVSDPATHQPSVDKFAQLINAEIAAKNHQ